MSVTLSVREDGPRAILTASQVDDGRGLYKAWVIGPQGRVLLGTMAPEHHRLIIKRTLSISELRRCGAWPVERAEAELAFAFPSKNLPAGWREAMEPCRLIKDRTLASHLQALGGLLTYSDRGGFFLAAPFSPTRPFPLIPLFCFASVESLGMEPYAVFSFDKEGRPCMLNNR